MFNQKLLLKNCLITKNFLNIFFIEFGLISHSLKIRMIIYYDLIEIIDDFLRWVSILNKFKSL